MLSKMLIALATASVLVVSFSGIALAAVLFGELKPLL